jgi:hypothetical protein
MIKTILGLLGVDDSSGPFTSNLKFTSGGTASADANTLDAYVEGTFSPAPTLTFGGGATGMTFLSRGGVYTKIGNMVFFTISIWLTAKGSSAGNILISGLPFTASNTMNFPVAMAADALTSGVGDSFLSASVQANTSTIIVYKYSAGAQVRLTDADFTDNSVLRMCGNYRV